MGRSFLASLLLLAATASFAQTSSKILPPDAPRKRKVPPAAVDDEGRPIDDGFAPILKRRRDRIDAQSAAAEEKRDGKFTLDHQIKQLEKEAEIPKPLETFTLFTLAKPQVITSGSERKRYVADMTAIFHLGVRIGETTKKQNPQVWTGLRIAPFAGSGVYKNVSGRFGMTYFGPMIGVGSFRLLEDEDDEGVGRGVGEDSIPGFWRTGWLWLGGIALQSRSSDTGVDGPHPEGDLDNQGLTLDPPGVWTELSYGALFFESMFSHLLVGAQSGKNKLFIYYGLGIGLWY